MNTNLIKEEIEKCAKCGKCKSVCPIYYQIPEEKFSARGRVRLAEAVLERELPVNEIIASFSLCIKCMRCLEVCPSQVRIDRLINFARYEYARQTRLSPFTKFFFRYILPNRKRYDKALKFFSILQRLMPRRKGGRLRHLPFLFKGGKSIPQLAQFPALSRFREKINSRPEKMRIALFLGCLINYVYPDIVKSITSILKRSNVSIIIPSKQLCCGFPLLSFGDIKTAKELARKNYKTFEEKGCDFIVTACASCGRMLKNEYPDVVGKKFLKKVLDVSEFIFEYTDFNPSKKEDINVTYHDPCHLKFGQGIEESPRALLKKSSNLIEMEDADLCCGGGGVFTFFYHGLSEKISRIKTEAIDKSNSQIVATGCPGCMMHIEDKLIQHDIKKRIVHIVDIAAGSGE